jgi:hypothetical protein
VLIEGPSDINDRIEELSLQHKLPIAVFSYSTGLDGASASWSPFCDYSPEWVALRAAEQAGARALFIDLPAWDKAFAGVKNRYSDRHTRAGERVQALCERLGVSDTDALWDHLFEQAAEPGELEARLRVYFNELREGDPPGEETCAREAFMARWIAWAMADAAASGGDVVVVCGGYHAPALEALWQTIPSEIAARRPSVDEPSPPADARPGATREETSGAPRPKSSSRRSYLVPYSFYRLDSFVGYEAGMPSPAYYQAVWEQGAEAAGEAMMFGAIERLRRKRQLVSPADAIAASSTAHALKRLRGHVTLARVDVLDGLAGALVKDALDAPLPWSRRGKLLPRTDPMLVEIVAAFSGDRAGELAPGTPRPPLVLDAFAAIEAAGIPYENRANSISVVLSEPSGLLQSRVLHRLRVLGVPGFSRTRALAPAPSQRRSRDPSAGLSEVWVVQRVLDADAALIEAAAYGATLEDAAAGQLEELLLHARDLGAVSALLFEAALIGASGLAGRLLGDIERAVWTEPSFSALGRALAHLIALWRHDVLLGVRGSPELAAVAQASFDRGLWLFEGIQGANAHLPQADVDAAVAMRDALTAIEGAALEGAPPPGAGATARAFRDRAHAVMQRRANDPDAPFTLRGAALGFLWSTGFYGDDHAASDRSAQGVREGEHVGEGEDAGALSRAEEDAVSVMRASARPETLGDFLVGLLALAREEVQRSRALLSATDAVLAEMPDRDFLIAVPSLRLAFSYVPPRERETIAALVIDLYKALDRRARASDARPRSLLTLDESAETILDGRRLELSITAIEQRFGLAEGTLEGL